MQASAPADTKEPTTKTDVSAMETDAHEFELTDEYLEMYYGDDDRNGEFNKSHVARDVVPSEEQLRAAANFAILSPKTK